MTDRKKPGVAFWVSVMVVVALVAYLLSMGPACWLRAKVDIPDWAVDGIDYAYSPIFWAIWNGPEWFRHIALPYLNWWTSPMTFALTSPSPMATLPLFAAPVTAKGGGVLNCKLGHRLQGQYLDSH
jgi:hypothetical protein